MKLTGLQIIRPLDPVAVEQAAHPGHFHDPAAGELGQGPMLSAGKVMDRITNMFASLRASSFGLSAGAGPGFQGSCGRNSCKSGLFRPSPFAQDGVEFGHAQDQHQGFPVGMRPKAEFSVERFHSLVDGLHDDGAGTDDIGGRAGASRCVDQQVGAEPWLW